MKGAHGEKFKEIFILKFNPHLLNTESEYLLKFSTRGTPLFTLVPTLMGAKFNSKGIPGRGNIKYKK